MLLKRVLVLAGMPMLCLGLLCGAQEAATPTKHTSTLYPPSVVQHLRACATDTEWGRRVRDELVEASRFWREQDDEALWKLMFGATITRTWMVWSNGHCPACGQSVPMYNWKMNALEHPWKTQCPHCQEFFPKNDFYAFYQSGLDAHGVFDPARADRALLFNAGHPDPNDPKHLFGVDDGEGYIEGDQRWRFIGAYLIYGQWKQAVLNGIRTLSAAYLMTGDPVYAHKAAVMLDRVADLYPSFDFATQALVYEVPGVRGYVSTWHDACEETRELAMAYDMIFEALGSDTALAPFLSAKAAQFGIENSKASVAGIQRNIESRILRDAVVNRQKIQTNYPRMEIAVSIMLAVLAWPENRDAFYEIVDPMLDKATSVDGVTGEKGLAGYSAFTIQALAMFLAEFSKISPDFLNELIARHPRLKETYRFHIDTRCLDSYYPQIGDSGTFAIQHPAYPGMNFVKPASGIKSFPQWTFLPPSCFTLLYRLYESTGDPAFAQIAYRANGNVIDGLPHDFYCEDPDAVRKGIEQVIAREGTAIKLGSVNKQEWHLALLRSGEGKDARALWLDYDSGGGHGHADGMNLGLFAKGLDLLPEFGYPQVQFGGWGSPRARWYTLSAAHNTIVVDGRNAAAGAGATTLWADGRLFRAIRANAPELNHGNRFERTAALIDISPQDAYVIDIFRLTGGSNHTKFMHSHFGTIETPGLALAPAPEYGHDTQMRNFQIDPQPQPGWHAEWTIDDRRRYLPEASQVRMRYTDVTAGAQAGRAEAWMVFGSFDSSEEMWLPRLVLQRQAKEGETLASTFAGVIEPYTAAAHIAEITRLPLLDNGGQTVGDNHVALQIVFDDGRRDILIARDQEDTGVDEMRLMATPPIQTDAEMCLLRLSTEGQVQYAALCRGARLLCGEQELFAGNSEAFKEFRGE